MIGHQMPFLDPAFLLLGQSSEHLSQVAAQLRIQRLPAAFGDEHDMVLSRHGICTPICCDLGSAARPSMELHCACALAAHGPEFHRWMAGEHPRKRQTSTASPAEPGELPMY